ncbi:hydroxyisourate hydrolase [Breoghania sp. L-A4]|uniref:hydroxyisourate hydrolase n=1 Tax=Breoghania sp. L-A4 TaxID=2304600 RepID=UPI000E3593AF|nr:hydroxyisourate hydrolase [Breoghania sp. L-A4]AXS40591.1 hydroxyisourate hydrolase [Breoghania sp. L-A4]
MGRLTTHVLDTASGRPAAGLTIELRRLGDDAGLLKTVATNNDGRVDAPLLEGDAYAPGVYELTFFAGDYLRGQGHDLPAPAFLDVVPIRFGIAAGEEHYHVPLLISPYGYSTYKGS